MSDIGENLKKARKIAGLRQEDAANKINGVNKATVSFMTQKLKLDADDVRFEEILDEIEKTCKKIEPDCKIVRS